MHGKLGSMLPYEKSIGTVRPILCLLSAQGNNTLPQVLEGCCPLIGYNKKVSSMISVQNPCDFISKRREGILILKLKNNYSTNQCLVLQPQDAILSDEDARALILKKLFEYDNGKRALERDSIDDFVQALKIIQNAALDRENVSTTFFALNSLIINRSYLFLLLGCVYDTNSEWEHSSITFLLAFQHDCWCCDD